MDSAPFLRGGPPSLPARNQIAPRVGRGGHRHPQKSPWGRFEPAFWFYRRFLRFGGRNSRGMGLPRSIERTCTFTPGAANRSRCPGVAKHGSFRPKQKNAGRFGGNKQTKYVKLWADIIWRRGRRSRRNRAPGRFFPKPRGLGSGGGRCGDVIELWSSPLSRFSWGVTRPPCSSVFGVFSGFAGPITGLLQCSSPQTPALKVADLLDILKIPKGSRSAGGAFQQSSSDSGAICRAEAGTGARRPPPQRLAALCDTEGAGRRKTTRAAARPSCGKSETIGTQGPHRLSSGPRQKIEAARSKFPYPPWIDARGTPG